VGPWALLSIELNRVPRLFSRFTISTTSQHFIRIGTAELEAEAETFDKEGVAIQAPPARPKTAVIHEIVIVKAFD
jgi:hypothetical protein